MNDTLIKGATLVDGTGAAARTGDIAFRDGRITEVGGRITSAARQIIQADGAIVTPAWVDIHTHYDGQATWDEAMEPSAGQGVGTVVMGNCGVGFAPVRPGGEQELIELMEGVEDIPGSVLHEGMPWGAWASFPEYLDVLAQRRWALDVGAMATHGAMRLAVMGDRGKRDEAATADELGRMQQLVHEALMAGALGFSTSRIRAHRSVLGDAVPGTFAAQDEVMAFAHALRRAERGVYQLIPSSAIGSAPLLGGERHSQLAELELMAKASRVSGRPVTFSLFQVDEWPDLWRQVLEQTQTYNAQGAQLHPQVGARPTAIVLSLRSYHPFMRKPSYLAMSDLGFAQRVQALRQPALKAALLSEPNVPHERPGSMENVIANMPMNWSQTYAMADCAGAHEPLASCSIEARAAAMGVAPLELLYDCLVAGEGTGFVMRFFTNYSQHNHDALHAMQTHPATVSGLGDAGAHVSMIFDAVAPTFLLTHWVRDRSRGERLPLAQVVHRQTQKNARLFGLNDRGTLAVGLRADLNLIDLDRLSLGELAVHHDLPAGGMRLLQPATGYLACFVHGVQTRADSADTGARPGRLVRSGGA